MNHKRKRPKNSRAGCLMCKPWKVNGAKTEQKLKPSERKRLQEELDRLDYARLAYAAQESGYFDESDTCSAEEILRRQAVSSRRVEQYLSEQRKKAKP